MAKSFIDNTDVNGTVKYFDANALIGSEIESGTFDETIQVSDYSGAVATLHVWDVSGRTPIRVLDKAIYTVNYEIKYKYNGNYINTPIAIDKVAVFNGTATTKPVDNVGFIIGIEYDSSGRRCTYHIGSTMMEISGTSSSWTTETGKITLISDLVLNPFQIIHVSGYAKGPDATAQAAIYDTGYTGYAGYTMYNNTTNAIFVGPNYFGGGAMCRHRLHRLHRFPVRLYRHNLQILNSAELSSATRR